jgi:hypothetical protein
MLSLSPNDLLMKRLFSIFLFSSTLLAVDLSAQTLSFSRVLTVDATPQTVPAGKVWKVENMVVPSGMFSSTSTNTSTPSPSNTYTFFLNGVENSATTLGGDIQAGYNSSTSSSTRIIMVPDRHMFPLWLPATSTLATGSGVSLFSVIEFTVNP